MGALACPLRFLPAHRAAAAGTPCPGPLVSEFSALFGGNLWLPLTLVSQSVCFCFLFSLPLFHACWLPCSSLPPFPHPPFLTTPFPLPVPGGSPGEDLERNDGSQERPYFMSPELRDILLKGSAEEGKQAEVEE